MSIFFKPSELKAIVKTCWTPSLIVDHVWDIDLESLYEKQYTTIILDVDNTIVSPKQKNISLRHLNWVQKCKDTGFKVYILSNNRSNRRIQRICDQTQCPGLYLACKPLTISLNYMKKELNLDLDRTIVVGDQISTDVLMGNWLKTYTILVEPIDETLTIIKRLQYESERLLLKLVS